MSTEKIANWYMRIAGPFGALMLAALSFFSFAALARGGNPSILKWLMASLAILLGIEALGIFYYSFLSWRRKV